VIKLAKRSGIVMLSDATPAEAAEYSRTPAGHTPTGRQRIREGGWLGRQPLVSGLRLQCFVTPCSAASFTVCPRAQSADRPIRPPAAGTSRSRRPPRRALRRCVRRCAERYQSVAALTVACKAAIPRIAPRSERRVVAQ
jgi:hypothetical protein